LIDSRKNLSELDASQQKALTALLACETVADAAKKSRLGVATLYRYLRDANFKAHYRAARTEIVEHAIAQLQRDCATATKTLREVCEDQTAPASARVSAAKTILEGAVKAVELQDLMTRLEEVERRLPGDEDTDK
jgi:uncharacterized protein (UPF0147 family)